jgi:hypothetical protein
VIVDPGDAPVFLETALVQQFESKTPNGIEGLCAVRASAPMGITLACRLEAVQLIGIGPKQVERSF